MAEQSSDRLVLDAYKTPSGYLAVSLAQLDANDAGIGYRLAGPKHYNGPTPPVLTRELDGRDAKEIRAMLDAVFPVPARVVDNPEDLDALPVWSIIMDAEGWARQKTAGGWTGVGGRLERSSVFVLRDAGPAVTVVWTPGGDR